MTSSADRAATEIVRVARSIFSRGLTHGRTGNVSVRVPDGILVTPTGSSLGTVTVADLSLIDEDGTHVSGPKPSKEAFLHAAVLRARPDSHAVVHTHSTYAVAVSCMRDVDQSDVLPPLTAYYVMRVGRLPLLPFHAPGDASLTALAETTASSCHAMLLRNHGPVVAGSDLPAALDALEELEETAKLFLLLRGTPVATVGDEHVAALRP